MNSELKLQKGRWYMIRQHGFEYGIKGKLIDHNEEFATMLFYWGAPFRTRNVVDVSRIMNECDPPSLFSNH